MRPVEDDWPEFWEQVNQAVLSARSSLDAYRADEHPHVVRVFALDWDLLEPLLDEPNYSHVRFRVFDADDLAYRFRIIAYLTPTGTIRLIEFDLFQ